MCIYIYIYIYKYIYMTIFIRFRSSSFLLFYSQPEELNGIQSL